MADAAFDRFGEVHVLCNNAGIGSGSEGKMWEHDPKDWDWCFAVNVFGVFNGIQAFVPRMLAQGTDGHIVNTSSGDGGTAPLPNRPAAPPERDTGEPRIVQQVRGQFASWAAVSLGCMGINIATGIDHPWFLFPTFGMGIGLLRNYARLWQAGYSWRDVLTRPPAPDAVETKMVKGARPPRQLPRPTFEEFGIQIKAIEQVREDAGRRETAEAG